MKSLFFLSNNCEPLTGPSTRFCGAENWLSIYAAADGCGVYIYLFTFFSGNLFSFSADLKTAGDPTHKNTLTPLHRDLMPRARCTNHPTPSSHTDWLDIPIVRRNESKNVYGPNDKNWLMGSGYWWRALYFCLPFTFQPDRAEKVKGADAFDLSYCAH